MYRSDQTFCVACSRWKKSAVEPALPSVKRNEQDQKKKVGRTTRLDTEVDEMSSAISAITSLPGYVNGFGKKPKDLETDVRSPKKQSSPDSGMLCCTRTAVINVGSFYRKEELQQ